MQFWNLHLSVFNACYNNYLGLIYIYSNFVTAVLVVLSFCLHCKCE